MLYLSSMMTIVRHSYKSTLPLQRLNVLLYSADMVDQKPKELTCPFWNDPDLTCHKTDSECKYAHAKMASIAPFPRNFTKPSSSSKLSLQEYINSIDHQSLMGANSDPIFVRDIPSTPVVDAWRIRGQLAIGPAKQSIINSLGMTSESLC
ncbi:hypothetical protein EJ08DRAFT_13634 [Tothia fuscella]|uniref:C3H1-type domain-containing protein n=1 Tax=Tothia fuscella TaxID=1048955 RepID=A0A9P4P4I9_9PEZI|nr:hypothetical protein EJ08DRAFT_13634 [Tothia fuscella]